MLDTLQGYREGADWVGFAWQASNLALLFPERRGELGLDEEAWEGMLGKLQGYREQAQWEGFAAQARDLAILAADEVHITSRGLELVKYATAETSPTLPDRSAA